MAPGLTFSVSPLPAKPTADERELNHLFRTKLILNCSDEFNQDLWNIHIPLASQSQAPIWHASIAFAALWRHQMAKSSGDTLFRQQMHEKSLRQYSAALNCVIQLTRKPEMSMADKTSILVANLLFLRCSMNRGDAKSAEAIISSSVQLVHHWNVWDGSASPLPIPTNLLVLFFSKIGRFLHQSLLTSGHSPWQWEEGLVALQPQPFASCTDACLELEMLWTGVRAIVEELPVQPTAKHVVRACESQLRFRDAFETWNGKFHILQKRPHIAKHNHARLVALLVRKTLVHIITSVDIGRLETSWDESFHRFRACDSSRRVVACGRRNGQRQDTLCTDAGQVPAHFMARVCR